MDLREIIKSVLDTNCLDTNGGKCNKGIIATGKAHEPYELAGSYNMCWLCHKNDDLSQHSTE